MAVSQNAHAQAQPCPDGQPGPLCIIDNSGDSGPITGTNGTATVINNSGTITGSPAVAMGGSAVLIVNNEADGTITGANGVAIQAAPRLAVGIDNSGTINGSVVVNDAPAPNAFTSGVVYYVSDGGTLNGNLQLGTTGFSLANFIQRGTDDGVTGSITAGQGIDIYTRSYGTSQSLTLGSQLLPATFEIEGFEVRGADTTVTLAGTGTTVNLSGNGNVVNTGTIGTLDTSGLYPPGVEVIPGAIGYYQTQTAVFLRPGMTPGQPGSFFVVPFGNALTSFANSATGVINGDIGLSAASFANAGVIDLVTHAFGSTIFNAANTAFVFDNSGSIEMAVNGARLPSALGEFESGTSAAIRLRSALNTTEAADVAIRNSGTISGGLDVKMAADDFVFENTGSIEGIDIPGGYSAPGLVLGVGELSLVAGQDPESHFDAATASILNGASGSIDHGFEAHLSAFEVTVVNNGFIAGSDRNPDALFVEQYLDADDVDATSFSFVNTGAFDGNVGLTAASTSVRIDNSGDVIGAEYIVNTTSFPDVMFGGANAFEIENGTNGNHTLSFTNSRSIVTTGHAGSGVTIEVEAGKDDADEGEAAFTGSANVAVANSGTISATGGATLVTQQFAQWLQPGQYLINPLAALAVDATDVNGDAVVTIDNQAGGLIRAGGTISVVTPGGYSPIANSVPGAFTVAVYATGKTINITNAGSIEGGAGVTPNANAVLNEVDLYDNFLAGAIQTAGDEYGEDEIYVASVDHLTNTATGTIVGSIDLGGNDDRIDNAGSITGDVFLRGGNDRVVNSGTIDGVVNLGDGDDVLELTTASIIYDVADLGIGDDRVVLAGADANVGQVAATANAERLVAASGSWRADGVQSEYGFLEIAQGATLTVVENSEGSLAIEAPTVALNGILNLDLSVDETEGDLGNTTIAGTGSLHLVGTATVELTNATGLQHTGGTFVENGELLLTTLYGGDITTSGEGVFELAAGGDFTGNLVNIGTFMFSREDDYSFLGDFSGSGLLEKRGAGTLAFDGLYAFDGTTTILGGLVTFTGQLAEDTELDLDEGTVDLSNIEGGEQTIAKLSGEGGTLQLGETHLIIEQMADTVFSGEILGLGTLVKEGEGDLKLEGDGTGFTGTGQVDGGTLSVNGDFSNADFEVNEGGTLGGAGTIGDTDVNGGTLAPGTRSTRSPWPAMSPSRLRRCTRSKSTPRAMPTG